MRAIIFANNTSESNCRLYFLSNWDCDDYLSFSCMWNSSEEYADIRLKFSLMVSKLLLSIKMEQLLCFYQRFLQGKDLPIIRDTICYFEIHIYSLCCCFGIHYYCREFYCDLTSVFSRCFVVTLSRRSAKIAVCQEIHMRSTFGSCSISPGSLHKISGEINFIDLETFHGLLCELSRL